MPVTSSARYDASSRDAVLMGEANRTIRLGGLRTAIELRNPGSAPGDLLVTAAAFYEFVTGAHDAAPCRDPQ